MANGGRSRSRPFPSRILPADRRLYFELLHCGNEVIMPWINIESLNPEVKAVAIDANFLLMKGARPHYNHRNLLLGFPTTNWHINYCLDVASLLQTLNIQPIFVFHGASLPYLKNIERYEERIRDHYFELALASDDGVNRTINSSIFYRKAFYISHEIAYQLIKELKKYFIKFIVAPYDGNAQMGYLFRKKIVQAVITNDLSVILFGCSRIILKINRFGFGYDFQTSNLLNIQKSNDFSFADFTEEMICDLFLLNGCKYVSAVADFFDIAHLLQTNKNYDEVVKKYNSSDMFPMDEDQLSSHEKVRMSFRYQRVYDPDKREMVHLSRLPPDMNLELDDDFLGEYLSKEKVTEIAEGNLNPVTMKPFEDEDNHASKRLKLNREDEVELFKIKKANFFIDKNSTFPYEGITDVWGWSSSSSTESTTDDEGVS